MAAKKKRPAKKAARKRGKSITPEGAQPPREEEKPKIGRPTLYTPELADEICRLLWDAPDGQIPLSLRKICQMEDMPGMTTVWEWLNKHEAFPKQYARAREMRKEALLDRLHDLNESLEDKAYGAPGTGEAGARVMAVRSQIDNLKWILSKEYARDYGDNIKHEHKGEINSHHRVSKELEDKIIENTQNAAAIAATVQPPASFRGEESDA